MNTCWYFAGAKYFNITDLERRRRCMYIAYKYILYIFIWRHLLFLFFFCIYGLFLSFHVVFFYLMFAYKILWKFHENRANWEFPISFCSLKKIVVKQTNTLMILKKTKINQIYLSNFLDLPVKKSHKSVEVNFDHKMYTSKRIRKIVVLKNTDQL